MISYYKTKKSPKEIKKMTVSLKELDKDFTEEEKRQIRVQAKYYETLMGLRQLRKKRNLTQEKLAKKAKIPRTTVSKIESGNRNVTVETLMNLAHAMGKKLEIRFV